MGRRYRGGVAKVATAQQMPARQVLFDRFDLASDRGCGCPLSDARRAHRRRARCALGATQARLVLEPTAHPAQGTHRVVSLEVLSAQNCLQRLSPVINAGRTQQESPRPIRIEGLLGHRNNTTGGCGIQLMISYRRSDRVAHVDKRDRERFEAGLVPERDCHFIIRME